MVSDKQINKATVKHTNVRIVQIQRKDLDFINHDVKRPQCLQGKRGNVIFFTSFVKNAEIRPSRSSKIILEQREERNQLRQFLKGTTRDLFDLF